MTQKFSLLHLSTKRKSYFKLIAKYCFLFLIFIGFNYQLNAQGGELGGRTTGVRKNIYVVNNNQSNDHAALRLQAYDGSLHRNWMMIARKEGDFQLGFWSGSRHRTRYQDRYDKIPLSLTEFGDLMVTGRGKFGNLSLGNFEGIENVSFSNQYLSSLSTPFLSNYSQTGITLLHGNNSIIFNIGERNILNNPTSVFSLNTNSAQFFRSVGIRKVPDVGYDLDVLGKIKSEEMHVDRLFIDGSEVLPNGNIGNFWSKATNNDLFYNDGNVAINTGRQLAEEALDVGGNIQVESGFGIILSNSEPSQLENTPKDGLLMYDRNFYETGETGYSIFEGNGGGLSVYNADDGWSPVIDGKNMIHLNASFKTVRVGNLSIENTASLTSTGVVTNTANIYNQEGLVLNSGSSLTKPNIYLKVATTEFNKPVSIIPQFSNSSSDFSLNVKGKVVINDNEIGSVLDAIPVIKNSRFTHDTSYFNVNGAFGVEGAASFLGETNFLGTISAEGGGALLGTYIIGNPLTGEGDSELGTHLIGDVNIGANLTNAFPGSTLVSDMLGSWDVANTKLNVHSDSNFSGRLIVGERNAETSLIDGPILEVDVATLGRILKVGSIKRAAKLETHGDVSINRTESEQLESGHIFLQHPEVFKVDTRAHVGQGEVTFGNSNQTIKKFTIYSDNVNIGSTISTPTDTTDEVKKLVVNGRTDIVGNLVARKIAVAADPENFSDWPDYVFEADYKLKSLEEIEEFIKINKHLPAVPSAKEVSENGLDLFKMDATLLKKVEELTLYTIAQEKQLKAQKEQLLAQEERLQKLEALLLDKK